MMGNINVIVLGAAGSLLAIFCMRSVSLLWRALGSLVAHTSNTEKGRIATINAGINAGIELAQPEAIIAFLVWRSWVAAANLLGFGISSLVAVFSAGVVQGDTAREGRMIAVACFMVVVAVVTGYRGVCELRYLFIVFSKFWPQFKG